VKKLVTRRPPRLTRPTLETLAIVAYRQPATRGEVEEIRGVDSGAVLRHLLEKKLIRILGRKEEPGRPLLYGTTREFLSFFSLKDLSSLPTLRDFAELSEEHRTALGLDPLPAEAGSHSDQAADDMFQVEFSDAYAPVGDDEVVQELAEALADVRRRDRELRNVLPASKKEPPAEEQPDSPPGEAPGDDGGAAGTEQKPDGAKQDGEN
jgi:segregation and condensation protein B